ncbi:MAG TPA: AraC family transcriptional regulator [Macromonas sp.]|nr:AraC family transcriptional regulator [Macromonas sp.]
MLRPIPLNRYLAVMQARGCSAEQVLQGTGIELEGLKYPEYLIDLGAYQRFIENVIDLGGDHGIGLDMGLARDIKDYGILGHASLASHSVRQAVEEFWGGYGDELGMMAKIVIPKGAGPTLDLEIVAARLSAPVYRFLVEEALLLLVRLGAQVTGTQTRLRGLQLAFAEPAYSARYRELFGCSVQFNAPASRASVDRQWFERPLATSDEELLKLYQLHLIKVQKQIKDSSSLPAQLRALFLRHGGKVPALDQAAKELGMSPRTFRRRLQEEGGSYRAIAEDFRRDLTLECLKSHRLTAKKISELVGYEDVNAFRRVFKKWTGQTVQSYRRNSA